MCDSNRYSSNSLKVCVLEFDLEYPKELHELNNDYHLTSENTRMKEEMLSKYQVLIAGFYNILIW